MYGQFTTVEFGTTAQREEALKLLMAAVQRIRVMKGFQAAYYLVVDELHIIVVTIFDTEEDLEAGRLPRRLEPFRGKLYALTIRPERLQQIRTERRPDSRYASRTQVQYELRAADALFSRYSIPVLDTSESSIEEIASRIMNTTGIERRLPL